MPILERNSIIYLTVIISSIVLACIVHPLLILLWPGVLLLDDIAYFLFAKSIFDTEIAVQRGYQFAYIFLDDQTGDGRDLGFNLYDGDLSKTGSQAQQDKWDFLLQKLDLKPGDRLIDIGCGFGDWLNYARSKRIDVIGVNISPEQARLAHSRYGLEVIITNWKDIQNTPALRDRLCGRFDAVTFMDTVEHYVPSKYRNRDDKIGEIYGNMFEMAYGLLKDTTERAKIFISCLHMTNPPKTLSDFFACYLQTRFHSGFYPVGDDGLVKWSTRYFTELERHDKTEDYRLTSVLDPSHFGSPDIRMTPQKVGFAILLFLIDPHHLHKWLEYRVDAWMWHFGKDAFNQNYDIDYQKRLRHVTLWWLVMQKCQNSASTTRAAETSLSYS
jgi:cyclopropane fatty-acyl-phospholipid synthase-like methyltransferase